jgi:ribosomal protein L11 methyltransferase
MSGGSLFELVLMVPEAGVEPVGDALVALDALSVSVEDADALTPAEQALFGEPGMPPPKEGWNRSRVVALFQDEAAAREASSLLLPQDFFDGAQVIGVRAVAEQDWVRLTQSQFDPVEITPTFWIVPTWHEPPAAAKEVIRLDPGLAFGTGTHPTTALCLEWLDGQQLEGTQVLDFGCGSGILAIAALLLGAREAVGTDIDVQAIEASRDNAQRNGIADEKLALYLPEHMPAMQADVLVANILAGPLVSLAPQLSGLVRPGGLLALSGILAEQGKDVAAAYAADFELDPIVVRDGWVRISGRRR